MKYKIGFNKKLKDSPAWRLSEEGQRELIEAGFAEYEDYQDHCVFYVIDQNKVIALMTFVVIMGKLFVSLCYVSKAYRRYGIAKNFYILLKEFSEKLEITRISFFVHKKNKDMHKVARYLGYKPELLLYVKEVG